MIDHHFRRGRHKMIDHDFRRGRYRTPGAAVSLVFSVLVLAAIVSLSVLMWGAAFVFGRWCARLLGWY